MDTNYCAHDMSAECLSESFAKKPVIEILWTGGYDSTFRIVQLSRLPISIKPYYLSDNRKSEKYELEAISKITATLMKKDTTRCEILPLTIIPMDKRVSGEDVTLAYNNLLKSDFFGSQYDWLGRFSREHNGIELCIHLDDKAIELINKYGKLTKMEDNIVGDYYVIDSANSRDEINIIFKNFHFPLAKLTKLDMKNEYIEYNCEDIMNMTWFCFTPINGKPCGICNPCKYTIEEGMVERFTQEALQRYRKHKFIRKVMDKTPRFVINVASDLRKLLIR